MDQAGVISESDLGSSAAPDGALSFGDPENTLNTSTRSIFVDTVGPAWLWFNNVFGYREWFDIKFGLGLKGDRWYRFQFNEDYTFAQIYDSITPLHLEIPSWILNFTMTRLTPPKDVCPPPRHASKEIYTKCATWRRDTGIIGTTRIWSYYAFEVVDKDGRLVQPYYSKFVEHMRKNTQADLEAAQKVGLTQKDLLGQDGRTYRILQTCGFVGAESAAGQRASSPVWWTVLTILILSFSAVVAILFGFCAHFFIMVDECLAECCKRLQTQQVDSHQSSDSSPSSASQGAGTQVVERKLAQASSTEPKRKSRTASPGPTKEAAEKDASRTSTSTGQSSQTGAPSKAEKQD